MEFPAIACLGFHAFANNHQPLSLFWPPTRPSPAENEAKCDNVGIRVIHRNWCVGGSAKGFLKRERKMDGGRSEKWERKIYQQTERSIM